MQEKNIMSYEPVLPEDFDGIFRFTNFSDEDFVGEWNKKEYLFPAGKTVAMIMPDHSPLEVQHIRKHFAKKLAEREFYKSKKYESLREREGTRDKLGMIQPRGQGMSHAGTYTINDLEAYIKQCLIAKEEDKLTSKPAKVSKVEDKLTRNNDGNFNTEAIDEKTSLRQKALAS